MKSKMKKVLLITSLLFFGLYYSASAFATNVYLIYYYESAAKVNQVGMGVHQCDGNITMVNGVATSFHTMEAVAYCDPPELIN